MSVKIRLTRMGKKKQPSYRVVVMDSRRPRDGAYIEQIGVYDPRREPSLIEIDNDKAVDWLRKGAQPTDRARKLLEISGAWTRFRVAKGDIHVIGEPASGSAAPTEPADEPVAEVVQQPAETAEEVTEASEGQDAAALAGPAADAEPVAEVTDEPVAEVIDEPVAEYAAEDAAVPELADAAAEMPAEPAEKPEAPTEPVAAGDADPAADDEGEPT
jgi:small subunit ribosomal protein S16